MSNRKLRRALSKRVAVQGKSEAQKIKLEDYVIKGTANVIFDSGERRTVEMKPYHISSCTDQSIISGAAVNNDIPFSKIVCIDVKIYANYGGLLLELTNSKENLHLIVDK